MITSISIEDATGINNFFIRSLDGGSIGIQEMSKDIETIRSRRPGKQDQDADRRFDEITMTIIGAQRYLAAVIEARYMIRANRGDVSHNDYE